MVILAVIRAQLKNSSSVMTAKIIKLLRQHIFWLLLKLIGYKRSAYSVLPIYVEIRLSHGKYRLAGDTIAFFNRLKVIHYVHRPSTSEQSERRKL